jgi:receptor expression-enhancing protein 5/6
MLTFVAKLSKYPFINNLEKQTSVPKSYAVLGLAASYFFFIFFNIGGQLLTNFAGFVIPGYYSLEALFSSGRADDTQWLTVSCCRIVYSASVTNSW